MHKILRVLRDRGDGDVGAAQGWARDMQTECQLHGMGFIVASKTHSAGIYNSLAGARYSHYHWTTDQPTSHILLSGYAISMTHAPTHTHSHRELFLNAAAAALFQ